MAVYKLNDYIELLEQSGLEPRFAAGSIPADGDILGLTADSREVAAGYMFICKGANFKQSYAVQAVESGAVVCVGENPIDGVGPFVRVSDIRLAMAVLAKKFYDDAPAKLVTAGITGTKGKSTTTHFLHSVLDSFMASEGRKETGLISTIETYDGVERFESHLTTPEPIDVYRHCYNAVGSGMSHMVIEVSSQALKYGRVEGIRFNVGCFLNIGQDHISPVEHADFDDYFHSKLRIFDISDAVCVNADSDHFDEIMEYAKGRCRVVTFGSHPQDDIYCSNIEIIDGKTHFHVRTPEYEGDMVLSISGLFNVSNALAVIAMAHVLGVPQECVRDGLYTAKVPGRMELFRSKDGKVVGIVNYAHNKLSFDATFQSAKIEYPGMKIVAIFGAAGGRAEIRRRDLPMTAEQYCDMILVTEDDPGPEPLEKICSEIAANISKCPYEIIYDRGDAIKRAVLDSSLGPRVIVATGKGDSSYMARGFDYVDYPSDVEFFQRYIEEYDRSTC